MRREMPSAARPARGAASAVASTAASTTAALLLLLLLPLPPPASSAVTSLREGVAPEAAGTTPGGGGGGGGGVVARLDEDVDIGSTLPAPTGGGCIQGGTLYASGSAMTSVSRSACERCYCVRGAVRCVRPTCLPPPPGCAPVLDASAAPACCPPRYRCAHPPAPAPRDCTATGRRYAEGAAVRGAGGSPCDSCYCVRGAVRCVELACSPPLLGCRPVLRRGECCPHRYDCSTPPAHDVRGRPERLPVTDNLLNFTEHERRSIHSALGVTARPRRDTEKPDEQTAPARKQPTTDPDEATSTTAATPPPPTEPPPPERSVRVVINGTINCTAEFSATRPPRASSERPTTPTATPESHTFDPSELITERGGYGDTFAVNVSALVRTNTTAPPALAAPPNVTEERADYDYEYGERTLPPSLPNLKIIPFVAADAVVEGAEPSPPPPSPLERRDVFPAYFPSGEGDGGGLRDYIPRPAPPPALELVRPHLPDYALVTSRATFHATDLPIPGPTSSSKERPSFGTEMHSINRFSPPVETEGGFMPKWGTPLASDYFGSQYDGIAPASPEPAAPPPPPRAPAINFDKHKECVSDDGLVVAAGDAVSVHAGGGGANCVRCKCTWGVLLCSDQLEHCEETRNTTTLATATETSSLGTSSAAPSPTALTESSRYPPAPAPTTPTAPHRDATERTTPTSVPTETSTGRDQTTPDRPLVERASSPVTTTGLALPSSTPSAPPTADYDESDEEDGGFSFGSVLKLLLSDSSDATTAPPTRRRPPAPPPFIPLPALPVGTTAPAPPASSERLALGVASPVERRSERPPAPATSPPTTPPPTVGASSTFTNLQENAIEEAAPAAPTGGGAGAFGGGMLKLAGCNIYGRMYRVGRIIAELSSACRQCMCTEVGVQCVPRRC